MRISLGLPFCVAPNHKKERDNKKTPILLLIDVLYRHEQVHE